LKKECRHTYCAVIGSFRAGGAWLAALGAGIGRRDIIAKGTGSHTGTHVEGEWRIA
jgi:hypothetical protein